ncbi:hypothetical protein HPP92_025416 [Vanilla planifolia]|uniref:Kinesin-like protein n=1 Tax=Vanilla planifolia TaxID=51239 RepID=A0A835U8X2_VANPL|nr:hypothetical protein HPP92_025416 [Vanilla planifolia]
MVVFVNGSGMMGSISGDDATNGAGEEERIFVSVRVRPLNSKEIDKHEQLDWEVINNDTIIFKSSLPDRAMLPTAYTFDRVFGCNSNTRQVYEEGAKEVALSVVNGINSSIFAYGQTSSGKTHTMIGITEYTVEDIYDYIQKHDERDFVLKFSAMEIYNEAVRDLLSMDITPLRLLDDPERGTVVEKLTEETLRDKSHLMELLDICEAQRQIGETSLNEASSRSHQILRLTIESSPKHYQPKSNSSSLAATVNFVDLAGSERASQTLSAGTGLKEGSHINRSLLTLGTVIRKLSKGRNAHVPYRDSKLTRILHNSLGGNARTAIICTMSPARSHIEQSRNTLLFASCAKEVATSARVNVVMSDKVLVKHLRRELARLEDELRYVDSTHKATHLDELKEKDTQIVKMEKEIRELIRQRDIAHSRLQELVSSVGDGHASRQSGESGRFLMPHARNLYEDGHSSRQWDESSQYSLQFPSTDQAFRQWDESSQISLRHEHNASEEESSVSGASVSEASGICYQSPEFGISKLKIPHFSNNYGANQQNSMKGGRYDPHKTYHAPKIARSISESSEEQCKEVQCIEVNDLNSNKEDFTLLLDEDCESLLPASFDDNSKSEDEPSLKQGVGFGLSLEHQIRMRQAGRQLVTPDADESLSSGSGDCPVPVAQSIFQDSKQCSHRPPPSSRKEIQRRPGNDPSGNCDPSFTDTEVSCGVAKKLDGSSDEDVKVLDIKNPDELLKARQNSIACEEKLRRRHSKTVSDMTIPSISNFVEELKDMAQVQYQSQLTHEQLETHHSLDENHQVEKGTKDGTNDPCYTPSNWPMEFEKQQREIIVLWDACNVSLIHRTYFFLLFKGEPADSIYMEVERRRLSFLIKMFSQGNENETVSSSLKNLRREREMLQRKMQKRLSSKERKALYCKWGIELNSKQRSMQLSQRLWSDTKDLEHVKESALLVSKLIGLLQPEKPLKEMFGLSFTPQGSHRRSSSWMRMSSFR